MKVFRLISERFLIGFFVCCFVLVGTYVPQDWNSIKMAEAGGGVAGGGSNLPMQIVQNASALAGNISASASAASNYITAFATQSDWIKENVLDGIGWSLAKSVVSKMTSSIVNWINTGFKGSPNFVQDLEGFLLNVADETMGQYISELGGPLSFICSPFRLDVTIALETSYSQARDGQPSGSACTLTGALANIENFVGGSFDQGGWETWFEVTSQPHLYTPYGNLLEAKSQGSIRLLNAKNGELATLSFGDGFLSTKLCETVHGAGTTKDNCFISTPGKVVSEALTFQLSTGPRALIEADEFNEIIAALFGQLANQAITGAAGILGLSGGTGYTSPGYSGGSYANAAAVGTTDPASLSKLLSDSLTAETKYRSAAETNLPILVAFATNPGVSDSRRSLAQVEANLIPPLLVTINSNITKLNALNAQYTALGANPTSEQLQQLMQEYVAVQFHQNSEVDAAIASWKSIVR
jgi:hypothetical protein